ncbi:hypothetical protein K438DRAFT_1974308 [Mycena galopus ATCC 62051]|nr:hypothetical protein K438DRAFT_1974308 [Mycena galopus ATCC 62051]
MTIQATADATSFSVVVARASLDLYFSVDAGKPCGLPPLANQVLVPPGAFTPPPLDTISFARLPVRWPRLWIAAAALNILKAAFLLTPPPAAPLTFLMVIATDGNPTLPNLPRFPIPLCVHFRARLGALARQTRPELLRRGLPTQLTSTTFMLDVAQVCCLQSHEYVSEIPATRALRVAPMPYLRITTDDQSCELAHVFRHVPAQQFLGVLRPTRSHYLLDDPTIGWQVQLAPHAQHSIPVNAPPSTDARHPIHTLPSAYSSPSKWLNTADRTLASGTQMIQMRYSSHSLAYSPRQLRP